MGGSERSGGIFNIGSQQAGIVNNVGGDQRIEGGQRVAASFTTTEAAQQLEWLRAETSHLDLSGPDRKRALHAIDGARAELEAPQPDRKRIAGHLESFASILVQAGALVGAGAALVAPLQRLAEWLGPLGSTLQTLLR
jgi:hypothetical protein